uniref:Extracellular matrix-binding protein ebh n=1 Tax=Zeugodacus cucurbitae TaxID=28588 RepID=A0A0A1WP89_ZEUCU
MSAEVASYPTSMPATPPPTPANFKSDEPKIYISSAKLELKLSAVQAQANNYVWHTQVVQPAVEVEEEVQEELVTETAAQKPVEAVNHDLYTPTKRHGEKPGTLAATLYDFMDVERYHSERNQLANKAVNNVLESTDV